MVDKDALTKEIDHITNIAHEIEIAMAMEEDRETRNKLSSALGQIKAGRAWLVKILKEVPK